MKRLRSSSQFRYSCNEMRMQGLKYNLLVCLSIWTICLHHWTYEIRNLKNLTIFAISKYIQENVKIQLRKRRLVRNFPEESLVVIAFSACYYVFKILCWCIYVFLLQRQTIAMICAINTNLLEIFLKILWKLFFA